MWSFLAHGIGCIAMCKFILDVYNWIQACFLRGGKNLAKEYGEWAVVTGATDGIGKAMALRLSAQGMKVLLVSRSADKLAEVKKEFKSGEVDTLAIDFSKFDDKAKKQLRDRLNGKDLGVVVNNVGVSYDFAMYFHEVDQERIRHLIDVNVDSTTAMCQIAVDIMMKKQTRKKGAIVNIASSMGSHPCPLYALYSASKEYVIRMTQNLACEYEPKGIDFQVQTPAFVTSKISKIRKSSLFVPTPEQYAKAAVSAIGYESEISPYWVHYAFVGFCKSLPHSVIQWYCMMTHVGIRKKGMSKREEAKKE